MWIEKENGISKDVVENSHVINRIVQKEETSEKVWKRDRVGDVRNERKQRRSV